VEAGSKEVEEECSNKEEDGNKEVCSNREEVGDGEPNKEEDGRSNKEEVDGEPSREEVVEDGNNNHNNKVVEECSNREAPNREEVEDGNNHHSHNNKIEATSGCCSSLFKNLYFLLSQFCHNKSLSYFSLFSSSMDSHLTLPS